MAQTKEIENFESPQVQEIGKFLHLVKTLEQMKPFLNGPKVYREIGSEKLLAASEEFLEFEKLYSTLHTVLSNTIATHGKLETIIVTDGFSKDQIATISQAGRPTSVPDSIIVFAREDIVTWLGWLNKAAEEAPEKAKNYPFYERHYNRLNAAIDAVCTERDMVQYIFSLSALKTATLRLREVMVPEHFLQKYGSNAGNIYVKRVKELQKMAEGKCSLTYGINEGSFYLEEPR